MPPSLPSSPQAATLLDAGYDERSNTNICGKHIDISLGTVGGAGFITSTPGLPKHIADVVEASSVEKGTTAIAKDTVPADEAAVVVEKDEEGNSNETSDGICGEGGDGYDDGDDDVGDNLKSIIGSSNDDLCIMEQQLNLMEEEVQGAQTEFEGLMSAMPLSSDVKSDRQLESPQKTSRSPSQLASSPSHVDDLHCRYGSFISELHSRHSTELRMWSDKLRERTNERDGALASAQGLEQRAMALQTEADQGQKEVEALKTKHERRMEKMKQDHARNIEKRDKEIKELKKLLKSARCVDGNSHSWTQRRKWGFGNNRRRIGFDDPAANTGSSDDKGSDRSVERENEPNADVEEDCCSESELAVAKTVIARLQHQLQSKDAEIEELTASNAAQASALYAARQETSRLRADRDILEIERSNEAKAIHERYGAVISELQK
eukprot:CAMPEP_0197439744 /NCGR_PEP_ID=MMETSP1175-20131217/6411_1 /TAXON_ID=1003142 /ORGANISM="Triceratium dubium, Strain CCMP147" /LENGTH=435 /DNA_ID=CAMNT_0042969709 /DNA_START=155 /DNA_END=1462 /DNA_ORIENTATION=-